MKELLTNLLINEQGLETVEYAIIAGLIVGASVATITAIGIWVSGSFSQVTTAVGAE